ncbi:MAG: 5-(carboxyamino)imidazole ribonucleotide synthase [Endozoicomonas sp. (ex Botrylloides leachii)]|nr:5-(carboxyamino)imidazole ribonucleotide synthase [Endozoicomonas sp. (ex Botrylloides leachii)]
MKKKVLVLGAGQLARMMAIAGGSLDIQLLAFDLNTRSIVHPLSRMISDKGLDSAIDWCDVITAEFEHIPYDILDRCQDSGKLLPTAQTIKIGGDRRLEKQALDAAGIKSAKYLIIHNRSDFDNAITQLELPLVFKSALGGYDGKGQWLLQHGKQAEAIWAELEKCLLSVENQGIIAEQHVHFSSEISVIGVRDQHGYSQTYPVTENTHNQGILSSSIVSENSSIQAKADQIFVRLSESLNYVGVLAIELFYVGDHLLVNEIAPRVHNSGHWTMQGAETCQFENHLRAVCSIPLGCTRMVRPTAMINLLGIDELPDEIYTIEGCHIHWYGKEKRPGRKMGHINISSASFQATRERVSRCYSRYTLSDL